MVVDRLSDVFNDWYQQGRVDAVSEFISNVLTELNAIATDEDYYFNQDNADLVSSVMYGQFEQLKEQEK